MPGNFSDWVAAAKEVTNQLGQAGIKVTLDLPQYAQYSTAIQGGTFDAAIGGFGGTGDPYTDFNNALNSSFATPVNTPTVEQLRAVQGPDRRPGSGHIGRRHRRVGADSRRRTRSRR